VTQAASKNHHGVNVSVEEGDALGGPGRGGRLVMVSERLRRDDSSGRENKETIG
jgi:hypothetical protein